MIAARPGSRAKLRGPPWARRHAELSLRESVQIRGRETLVGAGLRARPPSLPRCGWYTSRAGTETRPYDYTSILHSYPYGPGGGRPSCPKLGRSRVQSVAFTTQ